MKSDNYKIFKSENGALTAQYSNSEGKTFLVHSAVDPEHESTLLAPTDLWGDVILCLGTGLGYHLKRLKRTRRPLVVILIDNCIEFIEESAEKIDHPMLDVIKIPLFDDDQLKRNLDTVFKLIEKRERKIQIIKHPAAYRFAKEQMDRISTSIFAYQVTRRKSMETGSQFSTLKKNPERHRILLPFGKHFLQQELINGFNTMKVSFNILDYQGKQDNPDWESLSLKVLQEYQPSMILAVNMKGLDTEGILIDQAKKMGIPVHTWFVDDPRHIALAYKKENWSFIKAWTWERKYIPWLKDSGFSEPEWLPLAGDPTLFSIASKTIPKIYDFVFTGSAMIGESLNKIRRSFLWDETLDKLAIQQAQALLAKKCDLSTILKDIKLPFSDERNRMWLECLIVHMASHLKRREMLRPMLDHNLVLAGDPAGWKLTFPGYTNLLPDIDYRKNLCRHYQQSKIQINVTSMQMETAVNQRVFDVPLSGSFVLTDRQKDMEELFSQENIVVYGDKEELADKSKWFIEKDSERNRIQQLLREEILQRHTYLHRLQAILASNRN